MTHVERCECVRHCRWVDEVVADAPWTITQEFIDEHRLDYVAHDEDPYAGSDGSKDIYQFVKDQGTPRSPFFVSPLTHPDALRQIPPYPTDTWCIHLRPAPTRRCRLPSRRMGQQAPAQRFPRPTVHLDAWVAGYQVKGTYTAAGDESQWGSVAEQIGIAYEGITCVGAWGASVSWWLVCDERGGRGRNGCSRERKDEG